MDVLRKLRDGGHGNTRVHSNRDSGRMTVAQALADRQLLADNATAAAKIDVNVAVLKRETGLTDAEIVHIPAVFTGLQVDDGARMLNFFPGAINSLLAAPDRVIVARQWGPVVRGVDVFAKVVTAAYRSAGIRTDYIDDYLAYHIVDSR